MAHRSLQAKVYASSESPETIETIVNEDQDQRFSLSEAFEFEQNSGASTRDLEKAIRSAAYLVVWSSENGGVSPSLAWGLAETLAGCADEVSRLFTDDEVWALNGDPRIIRKKRNGQVPQQPKETDAVEAGR